MSNKNRIKSRAIQSVLRYLKKETKKKKLLIAMNFSMKIKMVV